MATDLSFLHDVIGNIMTIEKCRPYADQDSDEIGLSVVGRMNPDTGEVESLEILSYSHLILSRDPIRLEIPVAPGAICGEPAAAELHCLTPPDSEWLTFPADAEIIELYIPGWTEATEPSLT